MPYNIRIVSSYPPRKCGIATFSRNLANALEHFTGEVGHIRVAAIDKEGLSYAIPVDLVIDQYNAESWSSAITAIVARANEGTNPTIVILQHEYGLGPDADGNDFKGTNFVDMAKALCEQKLTTLVYLHTVSTEPTPHQKKVIQEISKYSNGLIVTTESAIEVLESDIYGIASIKVKHIHHGIRMQHPSQYDRLAIKADFGLKDRFLILTLGLHSPGKGIGYSIRAYGRFLTESCIPSQRERLVYLIAGQCHPTFVKAKGGELYREYQVTLEQSLIQSKLKWCKVKELAGVDYARYDVVFLDTFFDETVLLKLYAAANVVVLPYLSTQQISSGILADAMGSGRVAIATKYRYALELINSNKKCPDGLVVGRFTRGILVDPGEPSVDQIARALDYLVFNKERRLMMEKRVHQQGYQMRWNNSAWALLQYIDFVREEKEIVTGRGMEFVREKQSIYQD